MLGHDRILEAFRRADPNLTICDRGGNRGYTHVHGPSQPAGDGRCRTHWVLIEKHNGTVAFRRPLAHELSANPRPNLSIRNHPLGFSNRPSFGEFDLALESSAIEERWDTTDDFAREVIRRCRARGVW
jgi:hypothetical protein